jgi:hypothetical protein
LRISEEAMIKVDGIVILFDAAVGLGKDGEEKEGFAVQDRS